MTRERGAMVRQVLRCDAEGPGSRSEVVDYVEAALKDNTTLDAGVCLSAGVKAVVAAGFGHQLRGPGRAPDKFDDEAKAIYDEGRVRKLADNIVFSILHRLGVEQVWDEERGVWT
jgi:hypothetical protein